jgi:orotate phosphoribosyltransferase
VRSKPKEHGLGNQIEGVLPEAAKVVVIEDLISTGKSSMEAVEALIQAGAHIEGLCSVFTYGFDIAKDVFEKAGIRTLSLSNYAALTSFALQQGTITEEQMSLLQQWRESPSTWTGQ